MLICAEPLSKSSPSSPPQRYAHNLCSYLDACIITCTSVLGAGSLGTFLLPSARLLTVEQTHWHFFWPQTLTNVSYDTSN